MKEMIFLIMVEIPIKYTATQNAMFQIPQRPKLTHTNDK